jgi:capsule polysaccharide export protein KpsE/RkpR
MLSIGSVQFHLEKYANNAIILFFKTCFVFMLFEQEQFYAFWDQNIKLNFGPTILFSRIDVICFAGDQNHNLHTAYHLQTVRKVV